MIALIIDLERTLTQCNSNEVTMGSHSEGKSFKNFLKEQASVVDVHKQVLFSFFKDANNIVSLACEDMYSSRNIPLVGHVRLVDISQRRNLQVILAKFVRLMEFYVANKVKDALLVRETPDTDHSKGVVGRDHTRK